MASSKLSIALTSCTNFVFYWYMTNQTTLTRAEIANSIIKNGITTKRRASDLVDALIDHMLDAMEAGEKVKIVKFGAFTLRDKVEGAERNPKTGQTAVISARSVVSFQASAALKKSVSECID